MVVRDSWHENTPTDESREKTTAVGISKRGKKAPLKKPIDREIPSEENIFAIAKARSRKEKGTRHLFQPPSI